jgi:LysM repeat protein
MAVFSKLQSASAWLATGSLLVAMNAVAQTSVVVQSGDSLWSLARKHGVTVVELQDANQMGASEQIRAGQTLRLPASPATNTTRPRANEPPLANTPKPSGAGQVAEPKPTTASKPRSEPPSEPKPATSSPSPMVATTPSPVTEQSRQRAEKLYSRGAATTATSTLAERPPAWVLAEPAIETQGEKPSAARGGVFPCAAPEPGFAHYAKWVQVAPMAHVLAPPASPNLSSVRADGGFDVVFHFHGREPLRKEWVRAMEGTSSDAVLVAVDIGIASEPYRETFRDPRTFSQVLLAVESELQRRSGNPRAHAQNIALSSWSAGYGAVEQLLRQPIPMARVGSVVLLDGLHAGFQDASLNEDRIKPFLDFARRAAEGTRLMFVSHSSIRTPGYASTTQTARYLVWKVGGRPAATTGTASDPMGLERYATYSQGNFHVRGFAGSGASDHCAHLGLMRDVLNVHLQPFWQNTRQSVAPPEAVARRTP